MNDNAKATIDLLLATKAVVERDILLGLVTEEQLRYRFARGDRKQIAQDLKANGLSNRKIAEVLDVDPRTINRDLSEAFASESEAFASPPLDSRLIQQSLSNEHYTPEQYIEAARAVLGEIDLDPASNSTANQVVRAKKFFDTEADGLNQQWSGRIWLNPPYGDLVGRFIAKLITSPIEAAVILVNAHCTDTKWFQPLWDGVLCFTDHRINFYGDDERSGSTHGSVFVYFGENKDKFAREFARFGTVVRRYDNQ